MQKNAGKVRITLYRGAFTLPLLQWKSKENYIFWRYVCSLYIHGSVLHDIITKMTNTMQLFRIIYCSLTALHVSGHVFVHQEHLNYIYSFWYYSHMSLPAGFHDTSRQQHT